jgi:hypothetical protein
MTPQCFHHTHVHLTIIQPLESERPFKEGLHPEASGRVLRQRNTPWQSSIEFKKAPISNGLYRTFSFTPLSTCIGEASEFVDKVREELSDLMKPKLDYLIFEGKTPM